MMNEKNTKALALVLEFKILALVLEFKALALVIDKFIKKK